MNIKKKIFVIIIIIIITLPMLLTNFGKNQASDMDNRMLAEMPQKLELESIPLIEEYLKDRVGFRTFLITLYQETCACLFHVLPHPSYEYGNNEEIYSVWDLDNYQHLDVGTYPEEFGNYIKNMQEVTMLMGADFYYMMPPSKESVYFEDYVRGYNIDWSRPSRTELIEKEISKNKINYINVLSSFLENKNNTRLYNRKYDAGHYNANGMKDTCYLLYNRIRLDNPSLSQWDESYYTSSNVNQKYLMNSYFVINEMVPHYETNMENCKNDSDLLKMLGAKNSYYRHINNDNEEGVKLLIVGDSFSGVDGGMENYLSPYFYQINRIHTDNIADYLYYVSSLKPDVVLLEITERMMGEKNITIEQFHRNKYEVLESIDDNVGISRIDKGKLKIKGHDSFESVDGAIYDFVKVSLEDDSPNELIAVSNGHEYVAKKGENYWIFCFRQDDSLAEEPQYYSVKYEDK